MSEMRHLDARGQNMKFPVFLALFLVTSCSGSTRIEKVIRSSEPRVVKIGVVSKGRHGVCSGAIISSSGIILTCAHCFEGSVDKVFIKMSDGRAFPAQP